MDLPQRCEPCTSETPSLSEAAAEAHLTRLRGWRLEFPYLKRTDKLKDFRAALAWVNRVGMLAEEEQHHPDFHITGWNTVELVLYTHSIGGLSINDFVLAKKVDDLAAKDGHA